MIPGLGRFVRVPVRCCSVCIGPGLFHLAPS